MAQKITLTSYLAQRGVKAKALTKGEAELLGIPYPLQAGWPHKFGGVEIDEELHAQLTAHADAARLAASEKACRSQVKLRTAVPSGVQMPLDSARPQALISPVPGFVVRRARRYRARKPAPWA